jgi:peroxiredoxin (alkyl hydroperoxide reductase subunit C)
VARPSMGAQRKGLNMSVLVGKKAPHFKASAVFGDEIRDVELSDYIGKKYVVLFFYPFDFTFVCPTELHAFQEKLGQFKEKNVEVLGCSIDSPFTHSAWLNTPKDQGGIAGVEYGLIADVHKTIARDYDVLSEEEGASFRGLFLIDKEGMVQHQVVNNMPLGRNVDEALRMVDALQFHEKNGEVCPANWTEGDEAISTSRESVGAYLAKQ